MKKISAIIIASMIAAGIVSCDHDDITPDESNTALTPEELAKRNNQSSNNDDPANNPGGNETPQSNWKVVNTADERADDEIAVA
ncbi:MAG: hypothetical protein IJ933_01630, partial [Bacteroidales bacterium]|nr:hypothetical protein [Bacteroidales bacterium]